MTSITIIKLLSDGLLLMAIAYLAFKVLGKQQPGTIANLAKLKELEGSLKEIVKEADDAGRNLSEDLLSRKKDLESLLSEVEIAESRINKSRKSSEQAITDAEALENRLGKLTRQYLELIESQEALLDNSRPEQPVKNREVPAPMPELFAASPRSVRPESSTLSAQQHTGNSLHVNNYNAIPEPPSFSFQNPSVLVNNLTAQSLRDQIEVSSDNSASYSLNRIAQSADKIIKKTEAQPLLNQASRTERTDYVGDDLNIRQDPRLGVLGNFRKESQFL